MLYLLRHGEAEPKGTRPDEERRLAPRGRKEIRNVIKLGSSLGMDPKSILSSPFARAVETAEIARSSISLEVPKVVIEPALEPESTPYEVYRALSSSSKRFDGNLLLVTHQPLVSKLVSDLLRSAEARIAMPTGALAGIDIEGSPSFGSGTLVWLLRPRKE